MRYLSVDTKVKTLNRNIQDMITQHLVDTQVVINNIQDIQAALDMVHDTVMQANTAILMLNDNMFSCKQQLTLLNQQYINILNIIQPPPPPPPPNPDPVLT